MVEGAWVRGLWYLYGGLGFGVCGCCRNDPARQMHWPVENRRNRRPRGLRYRVSVMGGFTVA